MFHHLSAYLKSLAKTEKGQGMVEYGLIIGLVAVALITVLGGLSGKIQTLFEGISFTK